MDLVTLVKKEMKRFRRLLTTDYPKCLESQREEGEVVDGEGEEERRSITEGALKITLHLLRSLKQEKLADILMMSKKVFIHTFNMMESRKKECIQTFNMMESRKTVIIYNST